VGQLCSGSIGNNEAFTGEWRQCVQHGGNAGEQRTPAVASVVVFEESTTDESSAVSGAEESSMASRRQAVADRESFSNHAEHARVNKHDEWDICWTGVTFGMALRLHAHCLRQRRMLRRVPDGKQERSRITRHACVPTSKYANARRSRCQRHPPTLAGCEPHFLKAFELFHRPPNVRRRIANI